MGNSHANFCPAYCWHSITIHSCKQQTLHYGMSLHTLHHSHPPLSSACTHPFLPMNSQHLVIVIKHTPTPQRKSAHPPSFVQCMYYLPMPTPCEIPSPCTISPFQLPVNTHINPSPCTISPCQLPVNPPPPSPCTISPCQLPVTPTLSPHANSL